MRVLRPSLILALVIVSVWKCETWKNFPAAVRDAALFHVTPPVPHDFFQEWASSRNYANGLPLYLPQQQAYLREFNHLGFEPPPPDRTLPDMNPVNAHPPPSVLIFLPLASMSYVSAFRIWNLASIAMIALALLLLMRELKPTAVVAESAAGSPARPATGSGASGRNRWFWWLVVAILLVSHPLREQFFNGQLNPPLLLCVIGAWAAARRDRDVLAGVLLGLAVALKLFPVFLFIVPAVRRRWSTLVAGGVTIVVANLVAVGVFGVETYRDYVLEVMPALVVMQTSAYNASLVAFWKRLFDSPGVGFLPVVPWAHWPLVAMVGVALSAAAVVAAIVVLLLRARNRDDEDLAFGAAVVGMLLLSPITWPHGFLILLLPLVLLARRLRGAYAMSLGLACCLFVLTARPIWWLYRFQAWNGPFVHWTPPGGLWLVTTVALQGYALLALFVMLLLSAL
jgi:hypothetical protein